MKDNSHSGRRLADEPDIFLESFDNSEQNEHRCIFNFIFKIFWVGPLQSILIKWLIKGVLSAKSLLNYFAPLDAWLDEQLDESEIGWDEASVWTPAGFENFPEEAQPSNPTTPSSKTIFT